MSAFYRIFEFSLPSWVYFCPRLGEILIPRLHQKVADFISAFEMKKVRYASKTRNSFCSRYIRQFRKSVRLSSTTQPCSTVLTNRIPSWMSFREISYSGTPKICWGLSPKGHLVKGGHSYCKGWARYHAATLKRPHAIVVSFWNDCRISCDHFQNCVSGYCVCSPTLRSIANVAKKGLLLTVSETLAQAWACLEYP